MVLLYSSVNLDYGRLAREKNVFLLYFGPSVSSGGLQIS